MDGFPKQWAPGGMKLVTRTCAAFVGLISLVAMASWFSGWLAPLTFAPKSPPMAFNTALCLFLLAVGCAFPKNYWAQRSWIPAFLIPLLACLQYLFEVNLGIDEIFVSDYSWRLLSHPGQMPVPSAFCLLIASIGQWAFFQHRPRSAFPWGLLSVICFSIVTFLGVAGAVYYIASVSSDIFWGNFAKMSWLTAVCLVLLGTAGIHQSSQLLSFRHVSGWKVSGVACGVGLFLLSFLSWELRLMKNSARTSQLIHNQVAEKTQLLTKEFEKLALDFRKLQIPKRRSQVIKTHWEPRLPATQAVFRLRLAGKPELIWGQQTASEKDLRLLSNQIHRLPGFHFYESLTFQRNRWMGFSQNGYLLIFMPEKLVTRFFPENNFLYSLQSKDNILFSNTTNLPLVLQEWQTQSQLGLWDSNLTLHLSPTRRELSDLGSSSFVPYLLAGMLLSLATGALLSSVPNLRRRFSH